MADLAVWQRTIVDPQGNVLPGAEVEVRHADTAELADIYLDREGEQSAPNPITANSDGFVRFYAPGGAYRVEADDGELVAVWNFVAVGRLAENDVIEAEQFSSDAESHQEVRTKLNLIAASDEKLQAINAQVEAPEWAVAWADPEGNVAAGFDAQGRFVARIGQQVEQFENDSDGRYVWAVTDEAGAVALGVDRDGHTDVSNLDLSGGQLLSTETPGSAFALTDETGAVALAVDEEGITGVSGLNLSGGQMLSTETPWIAFAVTDETGAVALGVNETGYTAVTGLDLPGYDIRSIDLPDMTFAITDEAGAVALGVDVAGYTAVSGLNLPGYGIRSIDRSDIVFAIADETGAVAFAVYEDGTTSAGSGGGGDPEEPPQVFSAYAEPVDDPSKNLFFTWVSNREGAEMLQYRRRNPNGDWHQARSFRSRAFPTLNNLWLHTVLLEDLDPDTSYEITVPGTDFNERIKTCPESAEMRVVMASDWQGDDYSPATSTLKAFGDICTSEAPDLIIFNGDILQNSFYREDRAREFRDFLEMVYQYWRTADGALVPWVFVLGNHEGSGANEGGSNRMGMFQDMFSRAMVPEHTTAFSRGVSTVRCGDLAAFVCLDTDHFTLLSDQLPWFEGELSTHCPAVDYAFVVGHVAPFHPGNQYEWEPTRLMRNEFWTEAQQYSESDGPLKAWLSAHAHKVMATPRLKMAYDPLESAETNDGNFYRDNDGLYNIGCGCVGGPQLNYTAAIMDRESNIDSSLFWDAHLVASSSTNYRAEGNITNPMHPIYNIWVIDLNGDGWRARCINLNNELFYDLDEMVT